MRRLPLLLSVVCVGAICVSLEGVGSSTTEVKIHPKDLQSRSLSRKRRLFPLPFTNINCEFKYIIPFLTTNEEIHTFLYLETPINYKMYLDLGPFYTQQEIGRKIDGNYVFRQLENILTGFGFDSRSCLQKAVCDIASYSLKKPKGLMGDMLEVAFRHIPVSFSSTKNESILARSYEGAAAYGSEGHNCNEMFPECPVSIRSLINFHNLIKK